MTGDENEDAIERAALLLSLRKRGLRDPAVMRAVEQVPREMFVEPAFRRQAWRDQALPVECGQTISQPTVVALMTEALELEPAHKVLEVGTGTGYHAAILGNIAGHVVTLERFRTLAEAAARRLARLGLTNVEVFIADGRLGYPAGAPFDRIVLNAAVSEVPLALLAQLAPGGILVAPVGPPEGTQVLTRLRLGPDGMEKRDLSPVRFVPMLAGVAAVL
ncbi:protein-L-isoaspartate(D-aspartate) O-methyltransferase [Starkeya koreensis]|uniref:Protein-L-isoaspartate O-methyltransferase n=1 Tax=Ancylobacter koreensis TaxID=266121 RepID=A0ABT0DMG9_9HYPH|nr:protein-L-isoaspartate(D-aspartate) O-methyltransferase [Ancylobacter koreensis]